MSKNADLAVNFKSATIYIVRLVLYSADTSLVLTAIKTHLDKAAGFFENEPIVLDATELQQAPDWMAIVAFLQERSIPVVGFAASDALVDSGRQAGLVLLTLASARTATEAPSSQTSLAADLIIEPSPTNMTSQDSAHTSLIIDKPLRSGQKVYARHADLIVLGLVSQGAEVLADGNIHVYGPLRGKAMAGAMGNTQAKIFTTQFDAELVSVAGVYRALSSAPTSLHNQPAQVFLENEKLIIDSLSI